MVKKVTEATTINIRPRLFRETIQKYDHLSWERIENVKAIQSDSMCSVRPASLHMTPRFASLANPTIDVDPSQQWYKVEQAKFFSFYDFRLGFAVKESTPRDPNAQSEIGLDEVQVNHERVRGKRMWCKYGVCYMYENKLTCCCMPGFDVRIFIFH